MPKGEISRRGPKKFNENWQEVQRLRTTDPVLHYMQSMGKCIELGHMPDSYLPKATSEQVVDSIREKIYDALAQLFGGKYHMFLKSIGFTNTTTSHVRGKITNNQTPLHLRISIAMLMTHITGIREHLMDVERSLWVAMQQAHDPRLCTWEDYMDRRRAAYDRHITHQARPVFLPIRPIATIAHARGTKASNAIRDRLLAQARPWFSFKVKMSGPASPDELYRQAIERGMPLRKIQYVKKILGLPPGVVVHNDLVASVIKKEEERLGGEEALLEVLRKQALEKDKSHFHRIRIRSTKEPMPYHPRPQMRGKHHHSDKRSKRIARVKSKTPT